MAGWNYHLNVEPDALVRVLHSTKGRNTVFELQVNGTTHHVIVKAIQRDPVRRTLLHVDFRVVADDDMVTIEIPVKPVGTARGEEVGGYLVPVRRTVRV